MFEAIDSLRRSGTIFYHIMLQLYVDANAIMHAPEAQRTISSLCLEHYGLGGVTCTYNSETTCKKSNIKCLPETLKPS